MLAEKEILAAAKECGIPICGCTGPEPLADFLYILNQRKNEGRITTFERTPPEKRVDYLASYPQTKGVIVIGLPYGVKVPMPEDCADRGKIASVAWGMDYHKRVAEKLQNLFKMLKKKSSTLEGRCYVDNSSLLDRASAYRAGLGFFGKNNTLINPHFGSFFFIGQLLINDSIDFVEKEPLKSRCGDCTLCLRACPNGALHKGYTLEPERCVSYLTQKKKLMENQTALLGEQYLYGCDDCQLACPYNKGAMGNCPDEELNFKNIYPYLKDVESLDDASFEKSFGLTAAAWRGKEIFIRNAGIIKNKRKNHAKDKN